MSVLQRWLTLVAGATLLASYAPDLAAQRPDLSAIPTDPRLLQRGMSNEDVLAQLRASGLTRQQVRAELIRRGFDGSLADPYFDVLEREGGGRGSSAMMSALAGAGLTAGSGGLDDMDLLGGGGIPDLEALFLLTEEDRLAPGELPVFGMSFFRRVGVMDTPAYGPVEPDYRLGPGDEVTIILTGAVQDAYALRITREGTLVVPDLGELTVNGLTLDALERMLRIRVDDVYAADLTRVSVSLGRVRGIQVFVVGDVARPGPYPVSGLATVVGALYRAGGPSRTGSFREIEVRRGGTVVHRVDLYEYLLHGNSQVDARLQNGDVVFVPPATRRIRLDGAVRRPALYELRDGDGLRGALQFAGGPTAEAAMRRVKIERIVPPWEQTSGIDRVVIDVDGTRLLATQEPDIALQDGDRIFIDSVGDAQRNMVVLAGEVRRPGAYGWTAGTSLADVLERAAGMTEVAYAARAHIFRLDPATGERRLLSATLENGGAAGVMLQDRDSVVIYNRNDLMEEHFVTVGGQVRQPGRYRLYEGATVNDIILAAGGFADGAHRAEAYVARPNQAAGGMDAIAATYRIPLVRDTAGGLPNGAMAADDFSLRHGDRVEVRRAPGFEVPRTVVVDGEVLLPGAYVLETRADRVSAVLGAVGGFTDEAWPDGMHVIRNGQPLAVDVTGALSAAGSAADVVLQDGDTLRVPRFDPTILVVGAVMHDSVRVMYRPGMSLHDAIHEAGGFARGADRGRVTVANRNGVRETVQTRRLLPDYHPRPTPGSVVFVPERVPGVSDGINWTTFMSQVIAAAGAAATLLIALNQ
ncbi:MAG TPA: SLBB domain-containing protein [Longimicrobiales bacterium]|nr:SLBB domain-containing protein [Longimicrobiales bacterium]